MPATVPPAVAVSPDDPLVRIARTTGLFYLGVGITGMLGFLLVRPALFVPDDPAATLARLVEHEWMARAGIALEMGIVITQALAALWFFRLFRSVDDVAAGAIAVFGLVNAIAVLVSAAFLATALQVALAQTGPNAVDAHLMYLVSGNLWQVGNVFFGLWLIPMGLCVLRSGWMPRALGWVLVVGGVGYVLNAFVPYLMPDIGPMAGLLVLPATVGEFWMIGYLLTRGAGRSGSSPRPVSS
jgi:hypothetical protein